MINELLKVDKLIVLINVKMSNELNTLNKLNDLIKIIQLYQLIKLNELNELNMRIKRIRRSGRRPTGRRPPLCRADNGHPPLTAFFIT